MAILVSALATVAGSAIRVRGDLDRGDPDPVGTMTPTKPTLGWAIVNAKSGELMLFDGRCPVYWLRTVAVVAAERQGLCVTGSHPDARICRVGVRPVSGTKNGK